MGQLVAMPVRPEPIYFERMLEESDGAGGTTGTPTIVHECLAEWEILKSSKLLEAAQDSLRQAYLFKFWVNPAFEPESGDTIIFRDERLSNQGYRYTDASRKKYALTALEQVNG